MRQQGNKHTEQQKRDKRKTDRQTDRQTDRIHDSSSYHQITCKTGGGPVWTHNSITSVWSECLASLQIHHRKEPTGRYSTSESRPDISVFDTGAGSNVELDIALAHPWSSDIFLYLLQLMELRYQDEKTEKRQDTEKKHIQEVCLYR